MTVPFLGPGQAIGSAIAGKMSSPVGLGTRPVNPYGRTMWFAVQITGVGGQVTDLGNWSGCSGLNVQFGQQEVHEGGRYLTPRFLPTRLSYGQITLERAVTQRDSKETMKWLNLVARDWIVKSADTRKAGTASQNDDSYVGANVDIVLHSNPGSTEDIVHTWSLRNVIPVSWSGPTLSTAGGGVATEKLVLLHHGFLSPGVQDGTAKLKLALIEDNNPFYDQTEDEEIKFQYTPEQIKLSKAFEAKHNSGQGELRVTRSGMVGISFGDLRVVGSDEIKRTVTKLWRWARLLPATEAPKTAPAAVKPTTNCPKCAKETEKAAALGAHQVIRLTMGEANGGDLDRRVVLRRLDVNYDRFSAAGVPVRAQLSLTFEEAPETKPAAGLPNGKGGSTS